jgi:hypothetical protein
MMDMQWRRGYNDDYFTFRLILNVTVSKSIMHYY